MALTPKNWAVKDYTNNTWTNLVVGPAQIANILISNPTQAAVIVQVRLENGSGVEVVTLLPPSTIGINEVYTFEMRSVNVTGTQRIQVLAQTPGAGFLASGVV